MKQLSFIGKARETHGGSLAAQKKRKTFRPLSTKRPIHLVVKAKQAILYKNKAHIEQEFRRLGKRFGLRIYNIAAERNHVHATIRIFTREAYKKFIRSFTGLLAKKLGKNLWKCIPWTRILTWGREYKINRGYVQKNRDEAAGTRPYEPRKKKKTAMKIRSLHA